jgi:hypothetical protein
MALAVMVVTAKNSRSISRVEELMGGSDLSFKKLE